MADLKEQSLEKTSGSSNGRIFHLQIVSLDGLEFDGDVISVSCRCIDGDKAILAGHSNYCSAIGMGTAKVKMPAGEVRSAACIGGMLSMINGQCRLITDTWEWSDEIDKERANVAKKKAEAILAKDEASDKELRYAEAKLRRALVRINTVK